MHGFFGGGGEIDVDGMGKGAGAVIWMGDVIGTISWETGWGLAAISAPFLFLGGFNIGFFTSGGVLGFSGNTSAGLIVSGGVSVLRLEVVLLGVAGLDSESTPLLLFPFDAGALPLDAELPRLLSELPLRVLRLPAVSSVSERVSLSSSAGRPAEESRGSSKEEAPLRLDLVFIIFGF